MLARWPGGLGGAGAIGHPSGIAWLWRVAWPRARRWRTDPALQCHKSYDFGETRACYRCLCSIIIPPDPIDVLGAPLGHHLCRWFP